jgi:3-oxoacyl-[acyl-carrier protein] reductase
MKNRKLAGKVAVITGASKGIGSPVAGHLAAEGAAVVINYSSRNSGPDKVVAAIAGAGPPEVSID